MKSNVTKIIPKGNLRGNTAKINDLSNSYRKRKKLENELASANQRIENLQDFLVDGTISPKVYGQTLNRYTKQRDHITSNLNGLNTSDSEYKGLIENAFQHLENFKQTYTNSAIAHKKKLIFIPTGSVTVSDRIFLSLIGNL